ncbi:MAG: SCO family protein [Thermoleophilaceae bacterium]|nr:SCO family protein [Thermoleophilaceae bacterium]
MASSDEPSERRGPLRSKVLVALLAVCVAATAALAYLALAQAGDEPLAIVEEQSTPFRGGQLPAELAGAPAPSFRHADARGGEIGTADLAGRPFVVTFLYTTCPDVCPLIAQELREALELLGPRGDEVEVLAVSVDPENDTPEAVRSWLASNELSPNFHYLVGTEAELEPTWDAYFAAPQPAGEPGSAHTASIWLVDSDGRLRTKFSAGVPVPPADIAHDLGLLLDDVKRRQTRG